MDNEKKIKTFSHGRLGGHQERKIDLKDNSTKGIGDSNLISSVTNSFKIIYLKHLNQNEFEKKKLEKCI